MSRNARKRNGLTIQNLIMDMMSGMITQIIKQFNIYKTWHLIM